MILHKKVLKKVIEKRYKDKLIQKKLALLDEISDSFHGLLTEVDAKMVRIEYSL